MRNAGMDEAQAGIKIPEINISNLRYADDTSLKAESKELKSLLMKVKEESEKGGLKLNIKKTKIMASGPTTSWQIDAAAKSLQSCPTLCDPLDGSPPGSPSMGFSRQEHWSGLPFPSPANRWETVNSDRLYILGLQNQRRW